MKTGAAGSVNWVEIRKCGIFWGGWQLRCVGAEEVHQVKVDRQEMVGAGLGEETMGAICCVPVMSKALG